MVNSSLLISCTLNFLFRSLDSEYSKFGVLNLRDCEFLTLDHESFEV